MGDFVFTDLYERATNYFRLSFREALGKWKQISFEQHPIAEGLTIDSYRCEPFQKAEKLLVITGGEHGIEGYAAIAFLDIFQKEFLSLIDRNRVGLRILLPINPWGMKHHRRVNENNVDLNRTFVLDPEAIDRNANPAYTAALKLLQEEKPVRGYNLARFRFACRYLWMANRIGFSALREALTLGQFQYPRGLYYGGAQIQPSTAYMKRYFDEVFSSCDDIVHLDIHTGAGPKNRMTIVNSAFSPGESSEYELRYGYHPIVKTTNDEFYAMVGDMIDYINQMVPVKFPETKFYSTCFEYGLVGESPWGKLKSRQAIIQENQAFHHGAESESVHRLIRKRFEKVFYSSSEEWHRAMAEDTRRALSGILRAHRFIT